MIKVENLTYSYDENKEVLKNISFKVNKGEWLSIIGHNGSGKSTLAKLLIGLDGLDKGSIYYGENNDVLLSSETVDDIRKKVGIVFQNPDNQFVGATVLHDIAFGMENRNIPRDEMLKRIDKVVKIVGLEDLLSKEPQNLSGGQKQRVAIAGLLAMDLDIIIFDEATSMLDPEGRDDVIKLIKYLNKELKKTVITITHNLEFANLSDYILVLNDGNLILEGKPDYVFKHKEQLEQCGLEIPFINKLIIDLKNKGANKKIIDSLCKLNSNK